MISRLYQAIGFPSYIHFAVGHQKVCTTIARDIYPTQRFPFSWGILAGSKGNFYFSFLLEHCVCADIARAKGLGFLASNCIVSQIDIILEGITTYVCDCRSIFFSRFISFLPDFNVLDTDCPWLLPFLILGIFLPTEVYDNHPS